MNILVVILWVLASGDETLKGADAIGAASSVEQCQQVGVSFLTDNKDKVIEIMKRGVKPKLLCVHLDEMKPVPKYDGPVTTL